MVLYLFLLLFAVIGFFWLMTIPAKQRVRCSVDCRAGYLSSWSGGLLTLLRRGVIGIPLIIYWSFMVAAKSFESTGSSAEGQKSTVRSANLEMELDHDTGEMDGTILTGRHARCSSVFTEWRGDTIALL